jgi:hypothetical protein
VGRPLRPKISLDATSDFEQTSPARTTVDDDS